MPRDGEKGNTVLAEAFYDPERIGKVAEGMAGARKSMGDDTVNLPFPGALPVERASARARLWTIEVRNEGESLTAEPLFMVEVGPGEYKVGRSRAICDVQTCTDERLPSTTSRIHAVIICHASDGRVTVRDLGSRNGTSIGGVKITLGEDVLLKNGESFTAGAVSVRVLEVASPIIDSAPAKESAPADSRDPVPSSPRPKPKRTKRTKKSSRSV